MNLYDLWLIKTQKVPLTDHQMRRKDHLSASEAAILIGCHPFAYKKPSEMDGDDTVMLGKLLERPVLRWGAHITKNRILCNQYRVSGKYPLLSAQHDALSATNPDIGFECKTSGIAAPFLNREMWGDELTDQIPEWVIAQCQQQCIVSNLQTVWVPALLGGRGSVLYRVDRNEELCDILIEKAHEFWSKHVKTDIPPESEPPCLELARYMHRTPGKKIWISGWESVQSWQQLKQQADTLEKQAEAAQAMVLVQAGDADLVETEAGVLEIKRIVSERFDVKAFKEKNANLAANYLKPSTSVRVTWKANK